MCDPATALIGSSAISGGSSLLGGLFGSSAATSAAKTQAKAAQQAAQLQAAMFQLTREDLAPYRSVGEKTVDATYNMLQPGGLLDTTAWQPTIGQLEQTPGYQFTLNQGLKATQNALTSQGLGSSGAAGIAAQKYAEGLAETTYQDQFANWLNQRKTLYNMLGGLINTGESAAAGTASANLSAGSTIGSDITSGAASTAAGTVGSANALTNALTGIGGSANQLGLLYAMNQGGMFGNTAGTTISTSLFNDKNIGTASGEWSPLGQL